MFKLKFNTYVFSTIWILVVIFSEIKLISWTGLVTLAFTFALDLLFEQTVEIKKGKVNK